MPIFAGSLALLAPVGLADYSELAATLALLVGLILVLAGVFRAGWVADLLSIPVVTGFLAGIAIHIAISQAPALLGLPGGEGEVIYRLALIGQDIGKTNFVTLAIGASCLACIVLFEKIDPRFPRVLIARPAAHSSSSSRILTWKRGASGSSAPSNSRRRIPPSPRRR